jgi:hypothetical protein
MRFLVLHGLGGSGPDHWQTWLAERLRAAGHDVRYPALPDPDAPRLDAWLETLRASRGPDGDEVVLAHSLGCLLWLHHRGAGGGAPAQRALLVAPPGPRAAASTPEIAGFFPVPISGDEGARWVTSDDDPYCPEGARTLYTGPCDVLDGAGHVNPDTGYGPWPLAERWALGQVPGVAP